MPRTHKTLVPQPDRRVSCSRTPTKHRTWNPVWENTQTEQDYIHGPDCERSNRHLHANNFNREAGFILSCTWQPVASLLKCSPQPGIHNPGQVQWPFWLLPLARGVAFHPTTGRTEIFTAQSRTPSATKPPAHPEDGDGVSTQNVGKPHLATAVCLRIFYWQTHLFFKETVICPASW